MNKDLFKRCLQQTLMEDCGISEDDFDLMWTRTIKTYKDLWWPERIPEGWLTGIGYTLGVILSAGVTIVLYLLLTK